MRVIASTVYVPTRACPATHSGMQIKSSEPRTHNVTRVRVPDLVICVHVSRIHEYQGGECGDQWAIHEHTAAICVFVQYGHKLVRHRQVGSDALWDAYAGSSQGSQLWDTVFVGS